MVGNSIDFIWHLSYQKYIESVHYESSYNTVFFSSWFRLMSATVYKQGDVLFSLFLSAPHSFSATHLCLVLVWLECHMVCSRAHAE